VVKSATSSSAWPLPGAFLIPQALLLVADLLLLYVSDKDIFFVFGNG
jgi:hypothetical protein